MNKHPLKPGDILKASWGYDQTNINFFKVARLVGRTMVDLVPIGSKRVRAERGADYVVADPEKEIPPGQTVFDKLRKRPDANGVCKMLSWGCYARPWDGREAYQTALGWGH